MYTLYLLTFLYSGIEVEEGINGRICEMNEVMDIVTVFTLTYIKDRIISKVD